MLEFLISIDRAGYILINGLAGRSALCDGLMLLISDRRLWIGVAVLFLVVALAKKSRTALRCFGLLAVVVTLSDSLTYKVLKPSFGRSRPCYAESEARLISARCGSDVGFPSNHAANGMAVTAVAFWWWGFSVGGGFAFMTLAVGFSRVYLGVHYPGDVLGGFLVGAAISATVIVVGLKVRNIRYKDSA